MLATRLLLALAVTAFATDATAQSRNDLTVTPAWLAEHLKDPDLVIFHVGDPAEYAKEHIPGARLVTMRDVALSSDDHEKGLMLEVPPPDSLRARLAALGISDNSRIVVYYGKDWITPATRILFTLDHAGFGARSALLDGGMLAWKEENRAVTADVPANVTGKLSALKVKPLVVDAAFVQAHANKAGFKVVDGRASVFYDGVQAGMGGRKGHIAGAKSIPFTEIADDKLRLKSAADLRALFTKAGIAPGDTVVAYCHIGQQATGVIFAARTLGHPVLLYDAAFQEWGRRAELPVEGPKAP